MRITRGMLVAHEGAESAGSPAATASSQSAASATVAHDPAVVDVVAEPWAVYLLMCRGGKSYIGISPRPQERFAAHLAGRGAAFTRANPPEALAAMAWFGNRSAAASMEARLKALARPGKFAWFESFPATSTSMPATLEEGLAGLALLRR